MLFIGDIVRVTNSGNLISDGNDKKGAYSPSAERVSVTALKKIDAMLFLDALVDAMECGQIAYVKVALAAMKTFIDTVLLLAKEDCEELNRAELKKYPKSHKKQLEQSAADAMDVDGEEEEEEEEERLPLRRHRRKAAVAPKLRRQMPTKQKETKQTWRTSKSGRYQNTSPVRTRSRRRSSLFSSTRPSHACVTALSKQPGNLRPVQWKVSICS